MFTPTANIIQITPPTSSGLIWSFDRGQNSSTKPLGDYWYNNSINGKPSFAGALNGTTKVGTITDNIDFNSSAYYKTWDGTNYGVWGFQQNTPTASFNTLISIDKPVNNPGAYQSLWSRESSTAQFPVRKPDTAYLSAYLPGFIDFPTIPFDTGSWRMNVLTVAGNGGTTFTLRSYTNSNTYVEASGSIAVPYGGFDNYGGLIYGGNAANSWGNVKAMLYYNRQLTNTELTTIFDYYKSFGYFDPMPPSGDADATIYINAVLAAGGTLSAGEQTAINSFFVGLKADGIYSKLYIMYPFLGGVANSNKINALNPGTYDMTFNGSWAHSTTGSNAFAQNDSTYADTGYDIATSTAANNWTFGYIHWRNNSGNPYGYSGTGPGANYMVVGWSGTGTDVYYPGNATIANTVATNGAFIATVRNASNSWKAVGMISGSVASSGPSYSPTQTTTWSAPGSATNIYFNKINPSGFPSWGQYTFGFAAQALTDVEITNLVVRINDLQTVIGNKIFA